jgi:hypothetical protein
VLESTKEIVAVETVILRLKMHRSAFRKKEVWGKNVFCHAIDSPVYPPNSGTEALTANVTAFGERVYKQTIKTEGVY